MLRHSFLLVFRSFKRDKTTFLINLVGLSTGLTCTLLIYLWVHDELSVDKFFDHDSALFQVMQNIPTPNGIQTGEGTPGLLAESLTEEIPEIKHATSVVPSTWFDSDQGIISAKDKHLKVEGQFVDQDYFNVFTWNLIRGSKNDVLMDKYGVLISDELAIKLFNRYDGVIGESIEWKHDDFNGSYHISGIFEKPPSNSTAQFDLLLNYELFLEKYDYLQKWGNSSPNTYVILGEDVLPTELNDKIRDFHKFKYKQMVGTQGLGNIGTFFLQKYSERYLYNDYENGVQAGGRIDYVKLFSIIGFLILAIACINFMNLSTARASKRMKEIGIKKTVGSNQMVIIFQFLAESISIAILSVGIALVLTVILLPEFNEITGKQLTLHLSFEVIISVLIITLVTGLLSGSYPALYLSRLKPSLVLKGRLSPSIGEERARQGLVVIQFTISIILIISVLVIYKQIEFIQTKKLGVNTERIITFEKEGRLHNNLESFLQQLNSIEGVVSVTSSWHKLTGYRGGLGIGWEGKNPDIQFAIGNLEVDYNWIETMGIEMAEGRSFSREFGSDSSKVLLNEAAISAMGLEDPIGKTIRVFGMEKQIVGVSKNFHFEPLYQAVRPCLIQCYPNGRNVLVKVEAGQEQQTIARIADFYNRLNPETPFDYKYVDEDYQELYLSERRVAALSKYFAGAAIVISCLGLFGLAAFTTEKRIREIGIRKILGSNNFGIVRLLSGDFTIIVVIAIAIALPLSFLITKNWLGNFAYRIDLEWWVFFATGMVALIIAWLTVGFQTIKAAKVNPVECLRNE